MYTYDITVPFILLGDPLFTSALALVVGVFAFFVLYWLYRFAVSFIPLPS